MSISNFKKHIAVSNKTNKEYKEYLQVMKDEGEEDFYLASKSVMTYLHPNETLTGKDYQDINKLRRWYNNDQEA